MSLRPRLDYGYWRTLLRGSIAIGLALAIAQIYFRIDVLLLAALRDSVEVGLYGAAVKLLELAELVAAAIGITVFPLLARYVRSDPPRMRLLFQRTFDLLLAAAGALVVLDDGHRGRDRRPPLGRGVPRGGRRAAPARAVRPPLVRDRAAVARR